MSNIIPESVKVIQKFPSDPLEHLPKLPFKAPAFQPTSKITMERMNKQEIDKNTNLQPEEARLLQHILILNERSITFAEHEQGTFWNDHFSDYQMPVMEYEPWKERNIPLPPGH